MLFCLSAFLMDAIGIHAIFGGFMLGAVMPRGLMELIIINIGLQKGIIGPTLFSMLVLMAIATTMMAGPLFELVYGRHARATGELDSLDASLAAA